MRTVKWHPHTAKSDLNLESKYTESWFNVSHIPHRSRESVVCSGRVSRVGGVVSAGNHHCKHDSYVCVCSVLPHGHCSNRSPVFPFLFWRRPRLPQDLVLCVCSSSRHSGTTQRRRLNASPTASSFCMQKARRSSNDPPSLLNTQDAPLAFAKILDGEALPAPHPAADGARTPMQALAILVRRASIGPVNLAALATHHFPHHAPPPGKALSVRRVVRLASERQPL